MRRKFGESSLETCACASPLCQVCSAAGVCARRVAWGAHVPGSAVTGSLGLVSLHRALWGQDLLEVERPKGLVGSGPQPAALELWGQGSGGRGWLDRQGAARGDGRSGTGHHPEHPPLGTVAGAGGRRGGGTAVLLRGLAALWCPQGTAPGGSAVPGRIRVPQGRGLQPTCALCHLWSQERGCVRSGEPKEQAGSEPRAAPTGGLTSRAGGCCHFSAQSSLGRKWSSEVSPKVST